MKKLKCESCGGKLKVDESGEYGICEYCGSKYKLNEDIDVNINVNMNDNIKDVITSGKKLLLFIVPVIVVIILFTVINIINLKNRKPSSTPNSELSINVENMVNTQLVSNEISEFEISSFNGKFELYTGSRAKIHVDSLLDNVITNNKTKKDKIISVIYNDINTQDCDEITKIKYSVSQNKRYEVSLDYNSNGFVNCVTIKDIK